MQSLEKSFTQVLLTQTRIETDNLYETLMHIALESFAIIHIRCCSSIYWKSIPTKSSISKIYWHVSQYSNHLLFIMFHVFLIPNQLGICSYRNEQKVDEYLVHVESFLIVFALAFVFCTDANEFWRTNIWKMTREMETSSFWNTSNHLWGISDEIMTLPAFGFADISFFSRKRNDDSSDSHGSNSADRIFIDDVCIELAIINAWK